MPKPTLTARIIGGVIATAIVALVAKVFKARKASTQSA